MRNGSDRSQTSSAIHSARRERRSHALTGSDVNEISVYKRAYGQRRPPLIPPNYSGNAFRNEETVEPVNVEADEIKETQSADVREENVTSPPPPTVPDESAVEKRVKKSESPFTDLMRGTLGNEELLLLALIFITSQSGASDILPYLVILLFSK